MKMNARQRSKPKATRNITLSIENQPISISSKQKKKVTEKRLRRYRSSMTAGIYDRIERALHQRLYLLDTIKSSNPSIYREYKVLGQTANVYTIVISHLPSCTCPDYAKGHLCKHIIFVLHRVLRVNRNSPLLYQQALLTNELNEIFSKADSQNNDLTILAEQPIREAYHTKTDSTDEISNIIKQKSIKNNDECPICFETMTNDKDEVVFCSTSCGNNIHKTCFEKWRQAKLSTHESVTCPFCRVEWKYSIEKTNHPKGYLNLAAYSTTNDYDDEIDNFMYYNNYYYY